MSRKISKLPFLAKVDRIWLCQNEKIALLRFYEIEEGSEKRYLRNLVVTVDGHIVTPSMSETLHLIAELSYPYEPSNNVLRYSEVNGVKYMCFCDNDAPYAKTKILLSEARKMKKTLNASMRHHSMSRIFDFDFFLTPEILVEFLGEIQEAD